MNANSTSHRHINLKPVVIALALALPGGAALAAPMDDVVKTRADQNINQQYGRDSVYAFSLDKKPLTPERTSGSHAIPNGSEHAAAPSQQQPLAMSESKTDSSAGSGYTDNDANVGSGYTGSEWQTGYMIILPVEMAFDSEDNGIADSQVLVEDGTAHEYDRGYYKDPDQVAMVVVVPSDLEMIEQQALSDDDTAQQFVVIPSSEVSAAPDEAILTVLAD